MAIQKFVRVRVSAITDEELPIEEYLNDDGSEMSLQQIEEYINEIAPEILYNGFAMWATDVYIIEREVNG